MKQTNEATVKNPPACKRRGGGGVKSDPRGLPASRLLMDRAQQPSREEARAAAADAFRIQNHLRYITPFVFTPPWQRGGLNE
jgi:hypothetical protein